jgi:hypothetical protein
MSTHRIAEISKDAIVPISLSILCAMTVGIFFLARTVSEWESTMREIKSAMSKSWTYNMERESWAEYLRENPGVTIPNIPAIRAENQN